MRERQPRRYLRLLLVTVLSCSGLTGIDGLTSRSAALPGCTGYGYHLFDGYESTSNTNFAGWYGYLTAQQAVLCSSDTSTNNFSTAWVMLASSDGKQDFFQMGYFETYGRGTHNFEANELQSGNWGYVEYDDWGHTIPAGATHQYAVTKSENTPAVCVDPPRFDCVAGLIDGQIWGYPSYWEYYILPSPYQGNFLAETVYRTSDVPGTYVPAMTANIAYMDQGYRRWPMNSGWLIPYDNYPTWYQLSNVSAGPTFTIWDGPG